MAEQAPSPSASPPQRGVEQPAIVVGGGIAGLVAARRLALGGRRVVLLEASERFGGQVSHHEVGGIELDSGAESFAIRGGVVASLAADLGLGGEIVSPRESPAWLHRADGTSLPLPAASVLGIPGVPLSADVIAAVGFPAALRAQLDALLPARVGSRARTLGELVRRRMGSGVLEALVAPVTRGVHSAEPDDLALERANPALRAALLSEGSLARAVRSLRERAPAGSQVSGIRGGMSRLVVELLADLERLGVELRPGTRVTSVEAGAVTASSALGADERLHGDVVVAAPGVVGESTAGRRVTLVTLVVDAPELDAAPRGTGVLVSADAPGVQARALTHSTAKWAWLAERAGGRHVLRLSYDVPPESAAETARRDAETLLGVRIPTPLDSAVVQWTRAAPQRNSAPGLLFAGEAGAGTGLAAVISDALEQAGRLLHGHGGRDE